MANNLIQVKRTSVSGRAPTTSILQTGELALNMADGILYSSNGTNIFAIGANNNNVRVSGNLTVNYIIANGAIGTTGSFLASNSTGGMYWSNNIATSNVVANTLNSDYVNIGIGYLTVGNSTVNTVVSNSYVNTSTLIIKSINANGTIGTVGQALISNGSSAYWANNYTESNTAPVSPNFGDRWMNTDLGILSVYTYDSNGNQWVELAASGFVGPTGPVGYTGSQGPAGTNASGEPLAWVRFSGTGSIVSSFNVSSVSRTGTGTYVVTYATAMADANYSFVTGVQRDTTGVATMTLGSDSTGVLAASIKLYASYGSGGTFNPTSASIAIFE